MSNIQQSPNADCSKDGPTRDGREISRHAVEDSAPYASHEPRELAQHRRLCLAPTLRVSDLDDVTPTCNVHSHAELEARYLELKSLVVTEADDNFTQLKEQAEARDKVSTQLIEALKDELSQKATTSDDNQRMKAQLHLRDLQILRLEHNIQQLKSQSPAPQADTSVFMSQASSMGQPDTSRQQLIKSEIKQAWRSHRDVKVYEPPSSSQCKEDLYAELTGLLIRDVNVGHSANEVETTYDCIQTGRNGTLHFKLVVDQSNLTQAPEDSQFSYRPQLEHGRDDSVITILPDYLTEEISFPRSHVPKFYARVVKALTETTT